MNSLFCEIAGKKFLLSSVTFGQIYQLQYVEHERYCRFFQLFAQENKGLAEKAELLYIAYVCANLENDFMSEDLFYELLERDWAQISLLYSKVFLSKLDYEFQNTFKRRTQQMTNYFKMPSYKLADIEDYYSLYVLILGISEDTFWNKSVSFVCQVANNKSAFDGFLEYKKEEIRKKMLK